VSRTDENRDLTLFVALNENNAMPIDEGLVLSGRQGRVRVRRSVGSGAHMARLESVEIPVAPRG
jgi:hypothetical protein